MFERLKTVLEVVLGCSGVEKKIVQVVRCHSVFGSFISAFIVQFVRSFIHSFNLSFHYFVTRSLNYLSSVEIQSWVGN